MFFIIKLCTDHNTLCVKHTTHQNAESLRAASISKLGSVHLVCRRGDQRVLKIFQKIFRSPGDHRPKYFMAQ